MAKKTTTKDAPSPEAPKDSAWKTQVREIMDQIRPGLQADGGDVNILDISDDGIVKVELQGHCRGCPYSQMTLKNGIESVLKERVPEVKEVVNV